MAFPRGEWNRRATVEHALKSLHDLLASMGCGASSASSSSSSAEPAEIVAAREALARSEQGMSLQPALVSACAAGEAALVKQCLDAGAPADAQDEFGTSPMLPAIKRAPTPDSVVDALIEAGALVFKPDNEGTTPLHAAASRGLEGVVATLVGTMEVTLGAKDAQGRTTADLAWAGGHDSCLKHLGE